MTPAADPTRCSRCGAPKPAGVPCPHCLLQLGLSLPPRDAESSVWANPESPRARRTPSPEELARHFPGLEIQEAIGQGGMGVVYRARQKKLDRLVALKILAPELGGDPAFAERFLREARAMARLDHPNIVAVYDFGETDGLCWLLMELVDGVNLRVVLKSGELTPARALAIVPRLCDALQAAHDLGVVHRDIKPENVLLGKNGAVKIADFGLAKLSGAAGEHTLTNPSMTMGTLHYMAPEQLQGAHAVDHRADIFSLGVVFYEMLTGALPIGHFAPPSQRVQVDVRVDEIVLRSLAQEPERRYQQATEVKTDVQAMGTPAPRAAEPDEDDGEDDGEDDVEDDVELGADGNAHIVITMGAPGDEQKLPPWLRRLLPSTGVRKLDLSCEAGLVVGVLLFPPIARGLATSGLAGVALLVALCTGWLGYLSLSRARRNAVLAPELAQRSHPERLLRGLGFGVLAAAGLVAVGAGVETLWELGTDHYRSSTPHAYARVEPWDEEHGRRLLRELASPEAEPTVPETTEPAPELGAPARDRWRSSYPPNPAATLLLGGCLLFFAGLALSSTRARPAWSVALLPPLGAALLVGFTWALIQIRQSGQPETRNEVGGTARVQGDVERVRAALLAELAAAGDEIVLEVGETLLEERTRRPLARHELVAARPRSPLDRWELGRDGPRRLRPGLVFELAGALDGSVTWIRWDAGQLRQGESAGSAWRTSTEKWLRRLHGSSEDR